MTMKPDGTDSVECRTGFEKSFDATGWVSEVGPNRVAIEHQSVTKGISHRTVSIYTDPALN
jgi:hypothetical protein